MARLRTILRMQRDEFLPLRVIRQELAAGRSGETPTPGGDSHPGHSSPPGAATRLPPCERHRAQDSGALYSLEEVVEETQADAKLVRELEEYGVVRGEQRGGAALLRRNRAGDRARRRRTGTLRGRGSQPRVFRSSADREANLLQQILAPALRSRNPQRRKEALEALENLAAVTTNLRHLLLVRDLRKIAG